MGLERGRWACGCLLMNEQLVVIVMGCVEGKETTDSILAIQREVLH